jgi:hypothetical protein
MNFICLALVFSLLYKLSVEGVTIGVWAISSTCSGLAYKTYIAYSDLCTAQKGTAITLYDCDPSNVKLLIYDSEVQVGVPTCSNTGPKPTYIDASTTCAKFTNVGWVKIIENTCTAPKNVFIANLRPSACAATSQQKYSTIIADGTCRVWDESAFLSFPNTYTKASAVSNTTIDLKLFYESETCDSSALESVWDGISTTEACVNAALNVSDAEYRSASLIAPVHFTPDRLSKGTAAAITAIVGGVIGSIVCCCVCWGALHACGVVNCPCFNRCCDRRKNIASSNSNSFPSTAYATQAPRSSPYGNARL